MLDPAFMELIQSQIPEQPNGGTTTWGDTGGGDGQFQQLTNRTSSDDDEKIRLIQLIFDSAARVGINPWMFISLIEKESRTPEVEERPEFNVWANIEHDDNPAKGIAQINVAQHPEMAEIDPRTGKMKAYSPDLALDWAAKHFKARNIANTGRYANTHTPIGRYWQSMADYNTGAQSEGADREEGYVYGRDILRNVENLKERFEGRLDTEHWDRSAEREGYPTLGQSYTPGASFSEEIKKHLDNTSLLYEVVQGDTLTGIVTKNFYNQRFYDDWGWRDNNTASDHLEFAEAIAKYNDIGEGRKYPFLQEGMILRIPTPHQIASGERSRDAIGSDKTGFIRKAELGYDVALG